jgi:hypothetical protein
MERKHRLSVSQICLATMFGLLFFQSVLTNDAFAEYRVALVIGNGAYPVNPLAGPPKDAQKMIGVLPKLGFKVVGKMNVKKNEMIGLIRDFTPALHKF